MIEDNQTLALRPPQVVERFESHATRQGPVAYDGHNALAAAVQPTCSHQPCGNRQRRGRMPCHERVVWRLSGIYEPADAPTLAQRLKLLIAASEQFVRVALVTHVPDQLVDGRVQRNVQRNGQLDGAKVRCQMTAVRRARVQDDLAALCRQRAQMRDIQAADVGG